jgi:hypothetical protein
MYQNLATIIDIGDTLPQRKSGEGKVMICLFSRSLTKDKQCGNKAPFYMVAVHA